MSELFDPPFCTSILKVFYTQFFVIHCTSVYSAWFGSSFLRALIFLQFKDGGPKFLREPILQDVWIICPTPPPPNLYFNFKSFLGPNSSSLIRFQCIMHDSGVLFSEPWYFWKSKRGGQISGETNFAECLNYFVQPSVLQS